MRVPGGLDKLPVEGLDDVRSTEGPTKMHQKGFGKLPAGAAWRVRNVWVSIVFVFFLQVLLVRRY